MKTALRLSPLLLLSLFTFSACNSNDGAANHPSDDPANSGLVYASGWDLLRYADGWNKLDSTAHFQTDRNDCGWPAYGALELGLWNDIAKQINQAMAAQASVEGSEPCFPWPDPNTKGIDTTVELVSENKVVRKLFYVKDADICSGIADRELAKNLLETLRKLNVIIQTKECPNGWGSA